MKNLLKYLEPSIKARIEEIEEEFHVEVQEARKIYSIKQDEFLDMLTVEQKKKFFDNESYQGAICIIEEERMYRKGLSDGLKLMQDLNLAAHLQGGQTDGN